MSSSPLLFPWLRLKGFWVCCWTTNCRSLPAFPHQHAPADTLSTTSRGYVLFWSRKGCRFWSKLLSSHILTTAKCHPSSEAHPGCSNLTSPSLRSPTLNSSSTPITGYCWSTPIGLPCCVELALPTSRTCENHTLQYRPFDFSLTVSWTHGGMISIMIAGQQKDYLHQTENPTVPLHRGQLKKVSVCST